MTMTTDPGNQALQPGDTIAVFGASGNVGKLVSLRLSDTFRVHGIVRDASSVRDFFAGREDRIQLFEADLLDEMKKTSSDDNDSALFRALSEAHAVVICTGTTAFPTKAWSRNENQDVTGDVLAALVRAKGNVREALQSLDELGLNTPNNVDAEANRFILRAWHGATRARGALPAPAPQKRAVLLSSIGVRRRAQMPFPVLNACGVLDAKADAERALVDEAQARGYDYSIVRPGQLFGGPYTNNYYLGTLFQLDKDVSTRAVQVGKGDELLGDTLRTTLAEVTAQICETNSALNMDFCVVNVDGDAPPIDALRAQLKAM